MCILTDGDLLIKTSVQCTGPNSAEQLIVSDDETAEIDILLFPVTEQEY